MWLEAGSPRSWGDCQRRYCVEIGREIGWVTFSEVVRLYPDGKAATAESPWFASRGRFGAMVVQAFREVSSEANPA